MHGVYGTALAGALHRGEAAGIKKELGQEGAAQRTYPELFHFLGG